MKIEEFRKEFIEECSIRANNHSTYVTDEYLSEVISMLIDGEVIEDFQECYFEKTIRNKKTEIEGYFFDTIDKSLSIFISDYN